MMKQITLDTFKSEILDADRPVVLEFHGSFCTACTMMEPLLEKAEETYGDRILFAGIDADHEEMLNTFLNVRDLPALFFMKSGRTLMHHEGFMPASQLNAAIAELLDNS